MCIQKGLGAQKVNTDFKEIERAMQEQEKNKELEISRQIKNKEEQEKQLEKQLASMKLAYNNMDKQREKEEAKLMQSDPKKAQQLERLGMAAGTRSTGISHSAISDMQIIQQEGYSRGSSSNYSSQNQPTSAYGKNRDFSMNSIVIFQALNLRIIMDFMEEKKKKIIRLKDLVHVILFIYRILIY